MRFLVSTLLFVFFLTQVLAQVEGPTHSGAEPHICGQVNTPEQIAFLKSNNPNLNLAYRPSMDTIKVPILFHRIADENGNGAVSLTQVANALTDLNALYAEGRIVFEECEAPRLIVDSTYYDYEYSEEFALRQAHEVSGVINVFIPNRASSTSGGQVCGYAYLPPTRRDMTIVKKSCFTNGTTLPHEVGHFLGLYHTHGTSNCGSLTDELVDGSNCDTRGDDVCDTPADPNLLGIECDAYVVNSSCIYTGTETDANGDAFNPDTRNIMSYSRKACREGFSVGQLDRVRFYLGSTRSYLSCPSLICETTNPSPTITDWNMTSCTIAVEDNDQQSTELEYSVVGGATSSFTASQHVITIGGFSPCDSVVVRARNVCAGGVGEWSSYANVRIGGCGLQYCPQPNSDLHLDFSNLQVSNWQLPNLSNSNNYGVHPDLVNVILLPNNPIMELSFEPSVDPRGGPDSMYVQVWLDINFDNELEPSERLLQQVAVTSSTFNAILPIESWVPRSQQIRMRITTSVESFIDPCDTELGETEDVNIVFEEETDILRWAEDTIQLDAPMQSSALSLTADVNWSVVGLPAWLTTPSWNGTANDTMFNLDVQRNESCIARTHTLVLAGPNGLRDELVVIQHPASPGIEVVSPDTLEASPSSGIIQFGSSSAHLYQVASIDAWLQFSETELIDTNIHLFSYPRNSVDEDRYATLLFEGCGVEHSVVIHQPPGRTSWENTSEVYLQAVGDTVKLPVLSNVGWDALSSKTWLKAVDSSGRYNRVVTFVYTGNADSEEEAEIRLNPYFGLFDGPMAVRIIAPFVSSTRQPLLSAKLIMVNPISDRLVASTASAKTYNWSVFSSLGQPIHTSFGESLNVHTAVWPSGTYLIKIEDENGKSLSQRFIKL